MNGQFDIGNLFQQILDSILFADPGGVGAIFDPAQLQRCLGQF